MSDLIDLIAGKVIDIEMLKTQFANAIKVGPVAEISAEKGYRIKLSEGDDGPFLSPWLPHPESGGQSSSWMPLSVGQIVGVFSPNGDMRQAVLIRGGFGGSNDQPSFDLAANVLKAVGITYTMKDGRTTIDGDVTINGNVTIVGDVDIEGDFKVTGNVDFYEGHVQHNDTNISDTHVHGGITPGNSDTDFPH
ncbi:phage baseplate assembly protein gpV [Labrenzia sp. EL_126]|nr:phage baseplate assembly protein gpV [Labrenzia sp. EL_126]